MSSYRFLCGAQVMIVYHPKTGDTYPELDPLVGKTMKGPHLLMAVRRKEKGHGRGTWNHLGGHTESLEDYSGLQEFRVTVQDNMVMLGAICEVFEEGGIIHLLEPLFLGLTQDNFLPGKAYITAHFIAETTSNKLAKISQVEWAKGTQPQWIPWETYTQHMKFSLDHWDILIKELTVENRHSTENPGETPESWLKNETHKGAPPPPCTHSGPHGIDWSKSDRYWRESQFLFDPLVKLWKVRGMPKKIETAVKRNRSQEEAGASVGDQLTVHYLRYLQNRANEVHEEHTSLRPQIRIYVLVHHQFPEGHKFLVIPGDNGFTLPGGVPEVGAKIGSQGCVHAMEHLGCKDIAQEMSPRLLQAYYEVTDHRVAVTDKVVLFMVASINLIENVDAKFEKSPGWGKKRLWEGLGLTAWVDFNDILDAHEPHSEINGMPFGPPSDLRRVFSKHKTILDDNQLHHHWHHHVLQTEHIPNQEQSLSKLLDSGRRQRGLGQLCGAVFMPSSRQPLLNRHHTSDSYGSSDEESI